MTSYSYCWSLELHLPGPKLCLLGFFVILVKRAVVCVCERSCLSMCACVCVCMHTHMHTFVHINVHTCKVFTHMHTLPPLGVLQLTNWPALVLLSRSDSYACIHFAAGRHGSGAVDVLWVHHPPLALPHVSACQRAHPGSAALHSARPAPQSEQLGVRARSKRDSVSLCYDQWQSLF